MSSADLDTPAAARQGGRHVLEAALIDARARLLALWPAFTRGLGADLSVPQRPVLNLPLWELGHIAWFEEFWLSRNPLRGHGCAADPDVARAPSLMPGADALYHSSQVAHARRWQLALPDAARTLAYARQVRERSLTLLHATPDDDAALYLFRLALHHEDMHREAWVYMAQTLGLSLADTGVATGPGRIATAEAAAPASLSVPAHTLLLGSAGPGFAFDNEQPAHEVPVAAFEIDAAPVTWRRFLPFVDEGGYADDRWWSADGQVWRRQHGLPHPLHLRREGAGLWQAVRFGQWLPLDLDEPALHLSAHEAQAWCAWAGRRLPTEAEWQAAEAHARAQGQPFHAGRVWEWTASPFAPFDGFQAHPYRDYSQPWFDGRPVLKGGSFATAGRLCDSRYRNFFPAGRNDLFSGLRSCAAPA